MPELFHRVIIPVAVLNELTAPRTPDEIKTFISISPSWLEVRKADHVFDNELNLLDLGEREAILLAEELKADVLLMDEKSGREIAKGRKLLVIGTLGILERAAEKELIDFPEILLRLKSTGFYVAKPLEEEFLDRDRVRKQY